jgi:hypothetical protein
MSKERIACEGKGHLGNAQQENISQCIYFCKNRQVRRAAALFVSDRWTFFSAFGSRLRTGNGHLLDQKNSSSESESESEANATRTKIGDKSTRIRDECMRFVGFIAIL